MLAVTKARDFDHALAVANDSEYGLTGAVYTNNREQIAQGPRAASSSAICTSTASAPAPWWARIRSAGSICRARIPKPAARIICCCSCRPNRSPKRFRDTVSVFGDPRAPMRRGPRSHNSRVDSERRGEGRAFRALFHFHPPIIASSFFSGIWIELLGWEIGLFGNYDKF